MGENESEQEMSILSIQNLHKVYPNNQEALKGIDLEVQEGDFFSLLGPNGAGKSTAIGIVTSLVRKTSGSVHIYNFDLDTHPNEAKSMIGFVPQELNFSQFEKCVDIVVNQAGFYGLPRKHGYKNAKKYMSILELWDRKDSQARELSGGMKKRLMIARALVNEPRLLILDEPTAGMDVELRKTMWSFMQQLNRSGTSILLTTHYLEEAEQLCNRVAMIDHGEIIENTGMKDLLTKIDVESFLLDIRGQARVLPEIPDCQLRFEDDRTIIVDISRKISINRIFEALAAQGIEVMSIRNRASRLEALFLKLLGKK